MDDLTKALNNNPQAQQLLADKKAVGKLLKSPETRQLLQSLQQKNAQRLQEAAQSALRGDTAALTGVLEDLAKDPQAAKAMEQLDQTLQNNR